MPIYPDLKAIADRRDMDALKAMLPELILPKGDDAVTLAAQEVDELIEDDAFVWGDSIDDLLYAAAYADADEAWDEAAYWYQFPDNADMADDYDYREWCDDWVRANYPEVLNLEEEK